ncbi:PepSY domain-containing protein [Rhodoferax sp. UBA5149]|uniref:PepSY domain-containing protein n=1 Tax=Rhodoferax sp. UBA5149 TaxID=1947379 RepID=UPI0025F95ECA|nr:PepSY domain-containing protein [Rhodoferax sp. UBA5149]
MIASKKHVMTLLGLVLTVAAANVFAFTGQKLAGEAKISIEQARATALKAYPGKITDEELERENGGSGLRYSFDIRQGKVTQEVGVDGVTGKLLENAPEGPNPD